MPSLKLKKALIPTDGTPRNRKKDEFFKWAGEKEMKRINALPENGKAVALAALKSIHHKQKYPY